MPGFPVSRRVLSRLAAFRVRLLWRWRRLIVRRLRLCVVLVVGLTVVGIVAAPWLRDVVRGSTLLGLPQVRGRLLARPVPPGGVVRDGRIVARPVAPFLPGLASRPAPSVLVAPADHSGRWAFDDLRWGWSYVLLWEAEGCGPLFAAPVDPAPLRSVRIDIRFRSCLPGPVADRSR